MNERVFRQEIVLSAIAEGAHTFQEIACKCGGLYPRELRSLIEELMLCKKIILSAQEYHLVDQKKITDDVIQLHRRENYYAELPEPHPHDYDWRFDAITARRLANIAMRESTPGGKILLLGTPSVFIELIYAHGAPHTILLDWNSTLIDYISQFHLPNSFTLVEHNLLLGNLWHGNSQVDIVLCDPPWYMEHYNAFLAQAAYVTRIGARIVVSLLPPNTRPGAVADRWEIFKTAHKLGLHIISMDSNAIRYKTPIFELASLHSASIDMNKNWRVGDLVTFCKIDHPSWDVVTEVLSSANSMAMNTEEWAEILLDRYKVKLRGPFNDYLEEPELLPIEENDTLPTVSRRYKGREFIDLWLWDNRVFAVRGKSAFLAALHVLSGKPIPHTLQQVSEIYLKQALALLTHRARIMDFQTNEVWKVTRRGEYPFAPHSFGSGAGTA